MNKKAVLLWAIALLLLVACGGGDQTEPDTSATNNNTSSSTTTETTEEDNTSADSEEETEIEPTETGSETDEAVDEETSEEDSEETSTEEEAPAAEAASGSPFGDRPMSGTDPETGLIVNPETVNPGDTFIVRGEIISMNLTPTTSPEFLLESPDGFRFRIRSQSLADTFFEDGEQIQPFQYQKGLLVQATVSLAADASPSDIPTSADLVLIKDE